MFSPIAPTGKLMIDARKPTKQQIFKNPLTEIHQRELAVLQLPVQFSIS